MRRRGEGGWGGLGRRVLGECVRREREGVLVWGRGGDSARGGKGRDVLVCAWRGGGAFGGLWGERVCMCVCVCICMPVCLRLCVSMCSFLRLFLYILDVSVCICLFMHASVCIPI